MKNKFLLFPIAIFFFIFAACDDSKTEELDTPTKGKVRLSVDENIRAIADELIDVFEYSYPEAFLFQSYSSESKVVQELYDDSSRLALMTRQLTKEELAYFTAKTFIVEQIKIGYDAVVLVVNKNNPDSAFTVDQIRKIISGEDSVWSQLIPGSTLGNINVVFDNTSSSNLRYLRDTLLNNKSLGKNCFALNSNDSVIAYVHSNPNAIGVVGLNWIGNKFSNEDQGRRAMITKARIGMDTSSYANPDQSSLVTKAYPFTRGIWIIKIGKRAGLGTGFASFSLGERGQIIVQRAGLAPEKPAQRKIQLKVQ